MLGTCEYIDKSPKNQLEATLCVLWSKIGDWRLLSDDELQFRNQVYNELSVWPQRLAKRIAPLAQLGFAPPQKHSNKGLESLRQGGVGNVALVLVELA